MASTLRDVIYFGVIGYLTLIALCGVAMTILGVVADVLEATTTVAPRAARGARRAPLAGILLRRARLKKSRREINADSQNVN